MPGFARHPFGMSAGSSSPKRGRQYMHPQPSGRARRQPCRTSSQGGSPGAKVIGLAAAACVIFAASAAPAADIEPRIEATTAVPLHAGVDVDVELPYRIQTGVSVGWQPGAYVDVINGLAEALGAYGDTTSTLVRAALENAMQLGVSAGWRPLAGSGWELYGGYRFFALGGGVSGAEVIAAVTGTSVPGRGAVEVPLSSSVHAFEVGTGWRWFFGERWFATAAIGYFQIFHSQTRLPVETSRPALEPAWAALEQEVDSYLNDTLTTYAKAPVARVGLGVRFP